VERVRSSLLFDLFAAGQQVRTLLVRQMAGSGLRPDEYGVYSGIFEFEPIAPTELAAVVGMPPTTLSHYIRAMRERGHIGESRHPNDGRSRVLTLTHSGRAAHRKANRAFEGAYRSFVGRIHDQERVKDALRAVELAARDAAAELSVGRRRERQPASAGTIPDRATRATHTP
jgi:DNA-binding MarR family transcriptional regulator